ncbi:MAG: hypothetical protein K0U37_09815 [Gammaproteobacteria bacterium]|nr:hypothetical protein [Gammaproteobacteria bacterium]
MKRHQIAALVLMSTTFLSSAIAQVSLKDAVTSVDQWTGFYAGLNIGVVKNTLNITDIEATTFYATIQQSLNPNFTGGVQAGYRSQLDLAKVSGVYGLEFSANFLNATSRQVYGSPFALYQLSTESALKNILLLEAMGGIAAGKTLLFLAAGISGVSTTGSVTNIDSVPFFSTLNMKKTMFGTAVGGGVEYVFYKTFSARFKVDFVMPNTYLTFDNTGNDFRVSNNIVQGALGINYQFG